MKILPTSLPVRVPTSRPFLSACAVLFCIILVSCKSSDSTPETPIGDTPTGTVGQRLAGDTPYVRSGVNGSLEGEVWSAATGTRVNLDTGEIKLISEGQVFPRSDGREYVELINDFQFHAQRGCGGAPINSDAIFIRDSATDEASSAIEVFSRLAGPVLLSPDGNTMALYATGDDVCDDQTQYLATLMSRDGSVITTGSERVVGFDWMPDNRLAFMVLDDGNYKLVIETEPNTFSGFVMADLSGLDGFASRFRISPDGEQVLIEVVTELPPTLAILEYREATVWQMNIDGSNLRKLVDTSRISSTGVTGFADPLVNQPVWSPDGSNLLITENYLLGASINSNSAGIESQSYLDSITITPINENNVTYVMPSSTLLQRLPPATYSASGVRPLFALDAQGSNGILGINPIGRQVWTPPVANQASVSGAFPDTNGLVNRGFTGSLYLQALSTSNSATASVTTIDLASNSLNVIELNVINSASTLQRFDVSVDGQFIAALHREPLGDNIVNLYDSTGSLLQSFSQSNSQYDYTALGAIQISPLNENLVAWLFRSETGSDQGVVVLDMEDGRFFEVLDDREYDSFTFMPNGDLLLVDANRAFLSRSNSTGFAEPTLAFSHSEFMVDVIASPDGQRLAFSSLGRVFTVDPDGSNLVRVSAPSIYSYAFPAWSPDSQTLMFTGLATESSFEPSTYLVSADAQNVALYGDYLQDKIMQISESAEQPFRNADRVIWR